MLTRSKITSRAENHQTSNDSAQRGIAEASTTLARTGRSQSVPGIKFCESVDCIFNRNRCHYHCVLIGSKDSAQRGMAETTTTSARTIRSQLSLESSTVRLWTSCLTKIVATITVPCMTEGMQMNEVKYVTPQIQICGFWNFLQYPTAEFGNKHLNLRGESLRGQKLPCAFTRSIIEWIWLFVKRRNSFACDHCQSLHDQSSKLCKPKVNGWGIMLLYTS